MTHHAEAPRAILLTGPLGSGKTTVAVAAGDLLDRAGQRHAVVDLDWLCWAGPDVATDDLDRLLAANLAAVARGFRSAGFPSLVLCRTVTSMTQVDALRWAVGGALVAFRLSVPEAEVARRLASRPDAAADVAEAAALAPAGRLPLPAVRNHGRTAAQTAREVLERAGWALPSA